MPHMRDVTAALCCVAVILPSVVTAATAQMVEPGEPVHDGLRELMATPIPVWVLIVIAIIAIAAGSTAAVLRGRNRTLSHVRKTDLTYLARTQAELETAHAVLNTDPDAVFLWANGRDPKLYGGADVVPEGDVSDDVDRRQDPYGRFCRMLSETSRANLIAGVDGLRDSGARFAFPLFCDDGRTFASVGKPAGPGVALWISDVSEAFTEICDLRDALSNSEHERERLNEVLNAAPFPVWRRDEGGSLDWVNRAYAEAIEVESAVAAVQAGEELIDPRLLEKARESGTALRLQTVAGGERRTLDVSEVAADDAMFGFAIDVTELDEVRRDSRRQRDAQRATLNLVDEPLAIFGADKHLEFFNKAFAEFWHLPEEWLSGDPLHGEVLEAMRDGRRLPEQADFPAWKQQQLDIYTTLIESHEELWHLPDDRTLRVVTQSRPQGGILILYKDLTELLALERSFNALSRVQRESLNNLQEGVAVFGVDGCLGLFNPAFVRMWGLEPVQLGDGPHIDDVVELCQPQTMDEQFWDALKLRITGAEADRVRFESQTEQMGGVILDCTLVPLPDGGTMLTFGDISDSVQIERALRERNDALETADRLKSEFITHISYQLRTPLNSIIGFGEILEHEFFGELNERQHEYSRGLLEASHHLTELVGDVIDLATIEAGHMTLSRAPTDICALLMSVRDLSRQRAQEANMTLRLDCPADIGEINADARRIKQIIFNLLSNAFKFSMAGDEIVIGASRESASDGVGELCKLWVEDKGVGIEPDFKATMFETFESRPRKGSAKGIGIGLSLVRSLVELHGGWVEVDSETDQGAKVTCILPQWEETEAAPETPIRTIAHG